MKKEEFYYDSRDNRTKIHAVRYMPDRREPEYVLQFVHGMAEYAGRYEDLARFFTDRGFAVTGEDHLGHGKSVGEDGLYGYFCSQDPATVLVRDVHRLKKMTQQLFPAAPYFILGHSMGSFILRNYLCRYGSGISGAVIVGTGMQPAVQLAGGRFMAAAGSALLGPRHTAGFLNRAAFGAYNGRIGNRRTDMDWLSRDAGVVDRYLADPLCGFTFTANGFATLFELINRLRSRKNLSKIPSALPLLMVSGMEDPVGEYGRGVLRACESMKAAGVADIQVRLYGKDRHEVLNEPDREQIMEDIYGWIRAVRIE